MSRKIIQVATMPPVQTPSGLVNRESALYALCSDGTVWAMDMEGEHAASWYQLEAIPQDGES
jgi:hypothetical protein